MCAVNSLTHPLKKWVIEGEKQFEIRASCVYFVTNPSVPSKSGLHE